MRYERTVTSGGQHNHTMPAISAPCVFPQLFFDDLPVYGFIGKIEKILKTKELRFYLFTHFHFEIHWNENNIIEINVSSDPMRTVEITTPKDSSIEFSYSVKWKHTGIKFAKRMDRYSRYSFLPQHLEVGWLRAARDAHLHNQHTVHQSVCTLSTHASNPRRTQRQGLQEACCAETFQYCVVCVESEAPAWQT